MKGCGQPISFRHHLKLSRLCLGLLVVFSFRDEKQLIEENFLLNFDIAGGNYHFVVICQGLIGLQLITVLLLFQSLIRAQILGLLFANTYPG
jgi:hypothetical protein